MVQGDLFNIEGRLKTIDRDFILTFSPETGNYYISCRGKHFMTVKHGELDDRVVKHVRRIVYVNIYGDILEEVDQANLKEEDNRIRKLEDTFECMAQDIQPYVRGLKYDS